VRERSIERICPTWRGNSCWFFVCIFVRLLHPTLGVLFDREFTGERFVGGRLSIPLSIFNRNQGELESLEARRIQARAEIVALEKEIRKEVDEAIHIRTSKNST